MIPYISSFIGSCFSAFVYSHSKNISLRIFSEFLLFSFLFFPLAFRYEIGTDYANYTQILETAFQHNYMPGFEVGWYPIIHAIKIFNIDLQFFFIIPALFSVLIFLHVVPRKNIIFCLPVFFCFSWINSFNIVRQAFASIIFLLSLDSYRKKHIIFSFFWAIVAICFHKSAILLCALFFMAQFFKVPKNSYFVAALFVFIIGLFIFGKLGTRLFNVFAGYTPYAVYMKSEYAKQAKIGSGLGVLLKEIILFSLIFSTKKNKDLNLNKENSLVFVFIFTMGIAIALSSQIRILGRLANLFDAMYVFLVIHLVSVSSKYKKISLIFIFVVTSLLFFKTILSNPSSVKSGLGVFPYQSIFSR